MRTVSRWTRYFAAASALSLPVLFGLDAVGSSRLTTALAGVFWFLCPMVFGMAYLLLPPYVGRTLPFDRLPGVHFAASVVGGTAVVASSAFDLPGGVTVAGVVVWSAGVAVFLGSLLWTVASGVRERSPVLFRTDHPQRSTRAATAAIPVALGYLLAGTVGLLAWVGLVPSPVPATLPRVVHAYAAGFAALLVFALGARLLTGFFHVTPPRRATLLVLATGSVGPALLATNLWTGVAFRVGAFLEATAMVGYAGLVGYVGVRSSWDRVGLYGIALGAAAGAVGVVAALSVALGRGSADLLAVHVTTVLLGFFPLTVAGYAYQFFPVTTGTVPGGTERTALATLVLVALGVALRALGVVLGVGAVRGAGVFGSVLGGAGYAYLLGRRLLSG